MGNFEYYSPIILCLAPAWHNGEFSLYPAMDKGPRLILLV